MFFAKTSVSGLSLLRSASQLPEYECAQYFDRRRKSIKAWEIFSKARNSRLQDSLESSTNKKTII